MLQKKAKKRKLSELSKTEQNVLAKLNAMLETLILGKPSKPSTSDVVD